MVVVFVNAIYRTQAHRENIDRNYWGYEIDLLETVSGALDFTYTIVNPADGKWGHIEADGTWSGLVADAADGSVDFVIADVFIIYLRQQVFDGTTVTFDKVLSTERFFRSVARF